ncbi:MAG: undecaprenyldiphospho-muramoylpentapeptide beta-N-acetylglucosaminyltransferase [Candidatus Zixiibacteriota bacterium]|nr:MAG: undecaprenyldiphospho-muramoylpentapeptide beta-N-acetylglucosaminyltransferase [candidate division Zixibacteria bacterium]
MGTETARIVFAGGGTGGHLFPAIAIADRITELVQNKMTVDIAFVGTKRGLEYRMRESLGYPLHLINVRGIARSLTLRNLLVPFILIGALVQSMLLLRKLSPDVVVGTGGYVSWPVLKVAAFRKIVSVLQEQNSFPGITTRRLAQRAERIYLGFERAREHLRTKGKIIVTGNPVRASVMNGSRSEAIKAFGLDPEKKTILVLGGSQGARTVNNAVLASLEKTQLPAEYQLLWQTGKRDYKEVTARSGRKVTGCALFPFADRMDLVYAAADLAIGRAGALTLAELTACGLPSILIPYPHAAGDHQRKNAADLVNRKMAVVIDEKDLDTVDLLGEAVALHRSERFQQMKRTITEWNHGRRPAADVIAEDIVNLICEVRKAGC